MRQGKGAVTSMFVDIEIIGAETDSCKMKTTTVRKLTSYLYVSDAMSVCEAIDFKFLLIIK